MDEIYNTQQTRLAEVLYEAGLTSELDIDTVRRLCTEESLAIVERPTTQDKRGERFAHRIFGQPIDVHTLPVAFSGNAHLPAVTTLGEEYGFTPLITSSLSPENLELRQTRSAHAAQFDLDGYVSVLRAFRHYGLPGTLSTQARPFVFVGDSHGEDYRIRMPTADQLQTVGINTVLVFAEGSVGDVDLDQFAMSLAGKQQLAKVLCDYREAGITIVIRGLEAAGSGEDRRIPPADRYRPAGALGRLHAPRELTRILGRMRAAREQSSQDGER